jgi:hypothetical protein
MMVGSSGRETCSRCRPPRLPGLGVACSDLRQMVLMSCSQWAIRTTRSEQPRAEVHCVHGRVRRVLGVSTVIRTLLHVSDLHIGDVNPFNGNARFDAQAFAWWQLSRLFDGYLGHTHVALAKLEDLFEDLLEEGPTDVVVTGDLTTTGAPTQLQTALMYIRNEVPVRGGTPIGLMAPDAEIIPGNHDHWPGRVCHATQFFWCMCGASGPHLAQEFSALPKLCAPLPLTTKCKLVIAAINSDAQVGSASVDRVLARGAFVDQCVDLAARAGRCPGDELRVLLVHHSYVQAGIPLAMDKASKIALARLMTSCNFRLMLTGHAHTVAVKDIDIGKHQFRELRCGTTTARDHYNARWLAARMTSAIRLRKLPKNTALVHRISEHDARIYWATRVMERRSSAEPFTLVQDYDPIQVWP